MFLIYALVKILSEIINMLILARNFGSSCRVSKSLFRIEDIQLTAATLSSSGSTIVCSRKRLNTHQELYWKNFSHVFTLHSIPNVLLSLFCVFYKKYSSLFVGFCWIMSSESLSLNRCGCSVCRRRNIRKNRVMVVTKHSACIKTTTRCRVNRSSLIGWWVVRWRGRCWMLIGQRCIQTIVTFDLLIRWRFEIWWVRRGWKPTSSVHLRPLWIPDVVHSVLTGFIGAVFNRCRCCVCCCHWWLNIGKNTEFSKTFLRRHRECEGK